MSNAQALTIKTMTLADFNFAIELAAKEGWNPGLHDAAAFYAADPEGYLIGYLNEKPAGCISAVSYRNVFGFIGFYIVLPELRGKGLGIRLWDAAMKRLSGHNVGLDGVIEQQENYKKSGFTLAYSNIRFACSAKPGAPPDNSAIVPIQNVPLNLILAYDALCFPAGRSEFLSAWFTMPESRALAYVENKTLRGYGMIRPCRRGFKIGPLFADDPAIAETLYRALAAFPGTTADVYLDVPEKNRDALALAGKYQMEKVFGTARMYTGTTPDIALDKVFGVTTFELG